jgi:hypothetical protein
MSNTNGTRKTKKRGALSAKEGFTVGTGKKKKVISPKDVEKLAKLHCTYQEIADFLGINEDTLKYNFKEVILKARANTTQQLRRAQISTAITEHNPALLIWLGKNMLGQSDDPKPEDVGHQLEDLLPKIIRQEKK